MTYKRLTRVITFEVNSRKAMEKLFFSYFPKESADNLHPFHNEFKKNGIEIIIKFGNNNKVDYMRFYRNSVKTKIGV